MEATLIRGGDQKVMFMECEGVFVDTLVALLNAPLGSVIGAIAAEGSALPRPGAALCESFPALREPLFESPKASSLPGPFDFGSLGFGRWGSVRGPRIRLSGGGLIATDVAEDPQQGDDGKGRFRVVLCDTGFSAGRHAWRVRIASPGRFLIGVCTGQVTAEYREGGKTSLHQVGQAWVVCLPTDCGKDPYKWHKGQQSATGLPAMKKGGVLGVVLDCKARTVTFQVDGRGGTSATFTDLPAGEKLYPCAAFGGDGTRDGSLELQMELSVTKTMKPYAKFIVTNSLQVLESSSVTALEVMARCGVESLADIRSQIVQITPAELRLLVAGALLGRDDILDTTFPAASEGVGAATSLEGSDASYDVFQAEVEESLKSEIKENFSWEPAAQAGTDDWSAPSAPTYPSW